MLGEASTIQSKQIPHSTAVLSLKVVFTRAFWTCSPEELMTPVAGKELGIVIGGRESNFKNIPRPSSAKKKDEFWVRCWPLYNHLGYGTADLHHRGADVVEGIYRTMCSRTGDPLANSACIWGRGEYWKHDPVRFYVTAGNKCEISVYLTLSFSVFQ